MYDEEEESDDVGIEDDDATATDDYDSDGAHNSANESSAASQSIENLDIPELTTESYDEDPEVRICRDRQKMKLALLPLRAGFVYSYPPSYHLDRHSASVCKASPSCEPCGSRATGLL